MKDEQSEVYFANVVLRYQNWVTTKPYRGPTLNKQ